MNEDFLAAIVAREHHERRRTAGFVLALVVALLVFMLGLVLYACD